MDAKLGVNSYRMGIEWSRLQSEAYGPLHQTELARYIDQLDRLNAAGILPMIVLHHFSNPPWINALGGWTDAATIPKFIDFVSKLVPPCAATSACGIRSMNRTLMPAADI